MELIFLLWIGLAAIVGEWLLTRATPIRLHQGPFCAAEIPHRACRQWINRGVFGALADVRYPPESHRKSDLPDGRSVPIPTKVQRSNLMKLIRI